MRWRLITVRIVIFAAASVDMACQQLHRTFGLEAHASGRGRNEQGFALSDRRFAALVVDKRAAARKTHHHEERIHRRQLFFDRPVEIVACGREIGTRDELRFAVLCRRVVRPVIGQHGVVDRRFRQLIYSL